jgi:hypothetical protein
MDVEVIAVADVVASSMGIMVATTVGSMMNVGRTRAVPTNQVKSVDVVRMVARKVEAGSNPGFAVL